ncbi:uncharacterized protein LOC107483827 [Arachis duranensis]|uniref:Uncharacterized protein LOC107483827 n=1 Tax=Arachis duranensis TaxID=130453 RepID=A0A6P4D0F5_ARADU|nr:uncharacterized protein LOC107483827 [Arachis duranensis]
MVKLKERNKGSNSRKPKRDLNKVICYNCKEAGHFKTDCPKLKKEEKAKKGKKKGLMASWEDLENDSDEDEESETKSQTCLIANHVEQAGNGFLKEKLREVETAVDPVKENKRLKAEIKACEKQHSVVAYLNCFEENEKFLKEVYLASKRKDNMWYMDSGCSRHMTGKVTFFIKLDEYDGGFVTFGDNGNGKIVAKGKVGKNFSSFINDVLLVDGLKHNLLSISQLCDLSYEVIFRKLDCLVVCEKTGDILFEAKSASLDDDAGSEVDMNNQPSQENSKTVPSDEPDCLEMSHQDEGDISALSPEQARESRTVQSSEAHQGRTLPQRPREWKFLKGYHHDFIIGDPYQGITTRSSSKK